MSLKVGVIVLHPLKPDWGPGKVVRLDAESVSVYWRDAAERPVRRLMRRAVTLELSPEQTDLILDNLPPLVGADGKLVEPKVRLTLAQAKAKFSNRFPAGFYDPEYIDLERRFKDEAHLECVERLGNGRVRALLDGDPVLLINEVKRVYRSTKLLSPFEKAAITDVLEDAAATATLLRSLADVVECEDADEEVCTRYFKVVCDLPQARGRVATWPIASLTPYLTRPTVHLFLKPEVTNAAAEMLGFHLNYRAQPNWLTYRRLLEMGRVYMAQLADLKPRDLIDVQSFIWVVCGGYDKVK